MATLTAQTVTSSGTEPTVITPAAGGDKVPPGSRVRVSNGSAAEITVTLSTHKTADGDLTIPDRTITIAAAGVRNILAGGFYTNPDDGLVDIASSAQTDVAYEVTA